jgi:deferrochelatase/peroxidase EfeB
MSGDHPGGEGPARLGRRAFLGSAALGSAALGAAALAGCTPDAEGAAGPGRRVAFGGGHQPGIDTPAGRYGLLAAFNLVREDRAHLARSLRDLTDEARGLMEGRPPQRRDTAYPPAETGILGPDGRTDGLAVTVSVGASLFDDRFGLAERRRAVPRSWCGCRSWPTTASTRPRPTATCSWPCRPTSPTRCCTPSAS